MYIITGHSHINFLKCMGNSLQCDLFSVNSEDLVIDGRIILERNFGK